MSSASPENEVETPENEVEILENEVITPENEVIDSEIDVDPRVSTLTVEKFFISASCCRKTYHSLCSK